MQHGLFRVRSLRCLLTCTRYFFRHTVQRQSLSALYGGMRPVTIVPIPSIPSLQWAPPTPRAAPKTHPREPGGVGGVPAT